jgi:hypothetical protein
MAQAFYEPAIFRAAAELSQNVELEAQMVRLKGKGTALLQARNSTAVMPPGVLVLADSASWHRRDPEFLRSLGHEGHEEGERAAPARASLCFAVFPSCRFV